MASDTKKAGSLCFTGLSGLCCTVGRIEQLRQAIESKCNSSYGNPRLVPKLVPNAGDAPRLGVFGLSDFTAVNGRFPRRFAQGLPAPPLPAWHSPTQCNRAPHLPAMSPLPQISDDACRLAGFVQVGDKRAATIAGYGRSTRACAIRDRKPLVQSWGVTAMRDWRPRNVPALTLPQPCRGLLRSTSETAAHGRGIALPARLRKHHGHAFTTSGLACHSRTGPQPSQVRALPHRCRRCG